MYGLQKSQNGDKALACRANQHFCSVNRLSVAAHPSAAKPACASAPPPLLAAPAQDRCKRRADARVAAHPPDGRGGSSKNSEPITHTSVYRDLAGFWFLGRCWRNLTKYSGPVMSPSGAVVSLANCNRAHAHWLGSAQLVPIANRRPASNRHACPRPARLTAVATMRSTFRNERRASASWAQTDAQIQQHSMPRPSAENRIEPSWAPPDHAYVEAAVAAPPSNI